MVLTLHIILQYTTFAVFFFGVKFYATNLAKTTILIFLEMEARVINQSIPCPKVMKDGQKSGELVK